MRSFQRLGGLVLLFSMQVFAASPYIPIGSDSVFITDTQANEVKIMAWNVLNLFDTEKDMFSDDWVWLPQGYPGKMKYCKQIKVPQEADFCKKIDWNQNNLQRKLNQISKVVDYQGSKPDFLAVVEIENENVISQLGKTLGFSQWQVTDSGTRRGVDVALLYNLKAGLEYKGSESINTSTDSRHVGRDILRVDFDWNGSPFSIYVNHWVAQGGPNEARIANANALRANIEEMIRTRGAGFTYVAVGDFNTTEDEMPNAIKDVLLESKWMDRGIDLEKIARKNLSNDSLKYSPPGTYYYGQEDRWQPFDKIIGSQSLVDGKSIEFVSESYRIPFPKFMSFSRGSNSIEEHIPDDFLPLDTVDADRVIRVPNRYDFFTEDESKRGFSDHLPIIFKLKK